MEKIKVLCVEDNRKLVEAWKKHFAGNEQLMLLVAEDLEMAERLIRENPDIKIATLDGTVPEFINSPGFASTQSLIPSLQNLKVEIVLASSTPEFNRFAARVHKIPYTCDDKLEVPAKIEHLIKRIGWSVA